jgi:intracellular septation protein
MQHIIEYLPWVVFGLAYKFGGGLYPATAALMGSMVVVLAYDWVTTRKLPQMHLILAVMVWVFGAATLILHDVRFLQWKASVFYWIAGLALAGSAFIGRQTLIERLLGSALPEGVSLPARDWRVSSVFMGLFYLLLGAVNIWVALNRSENDWVNFKVWVSIPLGLAVTFGVFLWLFRKLIFTSEEKAP